MAKVNNSSRVKTEPKLLTVVLTGRNDNYMGNFKYRLATNINYLAHNLKDLGRLDDVEILVTDWNSDVPLSKVLALTPEAGQICRFVYVPPEIAVKYQDPKQVFNITCAGNVSLRRGQGRFSMIMGADSLIPGYALRSLFELLDGKIAIPFGLDSCLFLIGRKSIPSDAVQNEPTMDEWNHYLLMNSGELEYERQCPGLGISASAFMMHSSLWQACRGCDEQLSYWGWADADLTLRVTQRYPWMELMSIGALVFEMGHHQRARWVEEHRKLSPHRINLTFAVNDADWGLGNCQLEIQTPQNISKLPEVPEPSIVPGSVKALDKSRKELLDEMTAQDIYRHLSSIVQISWDVSSQEWAGLCAVAWYTLYHRPRCYLEFGICRGYAAAVVAKSLPSAEMYGISSWQAKGGMPVTPEGATALLHNVGYRGYLRLVGGEPATAFQRLQDSLNKPLLLDLVLMRGDIFGPDTIEQLGKVIPKLSPGGAVVFTSNSMEDFESTWEALRKKFPKLSYFHCRQFKTGIALAASLTDGYSDESQNYEESVLAAAWKRPRPKLLPLFKRIKRIGRRLLSRLE